MVALFDLDSLLYHSVYRIVSIKDIKELLNAGRDELSYKERKKLAFDYIIEEAYNRMGNKLLKVYNEIEETGIILTSYELYITNCSKSIRKEISSYYKSNRKRNKWVSEIRKRLISDKNALYDDEYEADDLIADRARELNEKGIEYLIISIDKDLKQIPGVHFDYYPIYEYSIDENGNKQKVFKQLKGISFTTPFESWKMLAVQVLMGDSGDRVKGIPKIGAKKAEIILKDCRTPKVFQNAVIRAYIANADKFEDNDWRSNLFMNYRLIYLGKT
jgi:5'-3' exonuclease